MRRPFPRLAAACAFAVAMTAFTGSAFAGNGNGTDTAPGQQKRDQAAAATQAPAPATQQQSVDQTQSGNKPPGQAKKQSTASASAHSATQLGVKPASNTTKWTHCRTGGTVGATTCTSSDSGHTPQPNIDASKKYGNGKTAAQIAVSRGGVNVQLTGPGNSQPHKVTVCGKPNNKSGGVDVHAVKSYSTTGCAQAPTQVTVAAATQQTAAQQAAVAALTPAASPAVQSSSVAPSPAAAPVTKSAAGGVLGVQTTLASPKPGHGGVLGTVTNVAGSSLPFTGFPIWLAVVLAVALILAGLALRRRGAPTRV